MSGCTPRIADTMTVPRIAKNRLTANDSSVPMNVSRNTRTGSPYQCGERDACRGAITCMGRILSGVCTIPQTRSRYWAGTVRQPCANAPPAPKERAADSRARADRRIHIEIQRQQINRNRIGERRFQILGLVTLSIRAVCRGQFAGLPGVERRFPFDSGFDLAPCQFAEIMRNTGSLDQRVPDVDIKLEGDGKLVVHQPRRDEHALRVAKIQVAMADGVVAQCDVVAVGDQRVVALAHRERDEIIGLAFERRGDPGRYGRDHAFEIERVDGNLSGAGVADSVGCLRDRSEPNHFGGAARDSWGCLRHSAFILHIEQERGSQAISPTRLGQTQNVGLNLPRYLFESTKSTVAAPLAFTVTDFSHVRGSVKIGRCTLCSVSTS